MFCEKCRVKPAAIHITEEARDPAGMPLTGGDIEHHFCEPCSRDYMAGGTAIKHILLSQKPTAHIEFHAAPEQTPVTPEPQMDTSKRYDIYCVEPHRQVVVYRNTRFKGGGSLLSAPSSRTLVSQFIELEQANGQSVFVARHSVIRFCEPGTTLTGEVVGNTQ